MSNLQVVERIYTLYGRCGKISTDSRKIEQGSIFFALSGDNFDGNQFAGAALEAGARAVVVDDQSVVPPRDRRYFVVANVQDALQSVAWMHRRQLGIRVLAITGSNGKTTTKELLSRVLSQKFNVFATQGNLNNHIGVPLTILSIPEDCDFAIIEMGANHRGEIEHLCRIAQPNYGLITNIGRAHLEGFGGIEGVISGKGELFDYMEEEGGTTFYLLDSKELSDMIKARPKIRSLGYSAATLEVAPSLDNTLTVKYNQHIIRSKLVGDYNRFNIAAALCVGKFFDIPLDKTIAAIESYTPENGRSQRKTTTRNILYIDAYNANPSSMKASIENFSNINDPDYQKVVILGDMRELGVYAEDEHREILKIVSESGIEKVFLVGQTFCKINNNNDYYTFGEVDELCKHLKNNPLSQYSILIKGSRGEHLEKTEPFL